MLFYWNPVDGDTQKSAVISTFKDLDECLSWMSNEYTARDECVEILMKCVRSDMAYTGRFGQSDDYRRKELIRKIEHSLESLTLLELETLYYDMSTKNNI